MVERFRVMQHNNDGIVSSSCVSLAFPPVLESTDGNWVALQNVNLPRPRMLAKPKSQVFKALESESSVVSAYDEMGSDSEDDYDWNVALNKLRQRPKQLSNYAGSQCNAEWECGNELYQPVASPSSGLFTNAEAVYSDSETSSVSSSREAREPSCLSWMQRRTCNSKPREEKAQFQEELDVNFNPQATSLDYSDSSESEEAYHDLEKRSRRWKKGKTQSEDLCKGKNRTKSHMKKLSTSQVIRLQLMQCIACKHQIYLCCSETQEQGINPHCSHFMSWSGLCQGQLQ